MKQTVIAILSVFCFSAAWGEVATAPEWHISPLNNPSAMHAQICLYRDKATAGIFSSGDWKAEILQTQLVDCAERMTADLDQRLVYLDVPGTWQQGLYLAGRADAFCPDNFPSHEYSPCTSYFFASADGDYRTISFDRIKEMIKESGLVALLDIERQNWEQKKQDANVGRVAYLAAYEQAMTLEDIRKFETTYESNDPDGLIEKLADKKAKLELQECRDRFTSAKTSQDYASFIADYKGKDPANLVPEAQRKLTEIEKIEVDKTEAAQRQTKLEELEFQIAWCKDQTEMAQSAIKREKEIGSVSGYVNTSALHQAGEIIVSCKASISNSYAEYHRLGGMKKLASIR
jgi:hypothetical protein